MSDRGYITFDELLVSCYGEEGARHWRWQHDLARDIWGDDYIDEHFVNPHHHAAVRFRHFVEAERNAIWAEDADDYLDAADNCGWYR